MTLKKALRDEEGKEGDPKRDIGKSLPSKKVLKMKVAVFGVEAYQFLEEGHALDLPLARALLAQHQ